MSFCAAQILDLATATHGDINSPSNVSIGFISGYYTSSGSFLGDFNNKLSTCVWVSGDSPCLVGFGPAEASIATLIYQTSYFKKLALSSLAGGGDTMWTTLKEGDSTITRSSMIDVAKQYRELHKTAEEELKTAIHYYTLNHSVPMSIEGQDSYGFPSP
jgi:hypothetical protein